MSTQDADEIDATVGKLLHALRQPGALAPDDLDTMLGSFADTAEADNGAGGVSPNRLLQISQALGVPLFSKDQPAAAGSASTTDLMAAALSLRLLKAFNRIEDPAAREGLVRLIERAAGRG